MHSSANFILQDYKAILFSETNEREIQEFSALCEAKNPVLIDNFDDQKLDYLYCRFPHLGMQKKSAEEMNQVWREAGNDEIKANWVYFPWKNTAVKILQKEEFITVRTNRNKVKITESEQAILGTKSVLFVGLSVGQSAALTFATQRLCGELHLADFDTLSLSNMNRLRASLTDIGLHKTIIAARMIAELDPYLTVHCYHEGATVENVAALLSPNGKKVDLVVEECDSVQIKFLVREKAREMKIPVIMETSDKGMLDIEKFDEEPERSIFHGLVGNATSEQIGQMNPPERFGVLQKLVGVENISQGLMQSYQLLGKEVLTWPQLAGEVMLGGATLAWAGLKILLQHPLKSGRYYVDLEKFLNNQS